MSNRLSYNSVNSSGLSGLNDDLDDIFNNYVQTAGIKPDTNGSGVGRSRGSNADGHNALSRGSDHTVSNNLATNSYSITNSNDTLEEKPRRLIPQKVLDRFDPDSLPMHVSSRLSSLKNSDDAIQSAPQTPNSTSSFEFQPRPQPHPAMSNGSLNILDTPPMDSFYKDLASPNYGLEKSTDAIKSLDIGDDDTDTDKSHWNDKGAATKTVGDETNGFRVIRRTVQDFEFGDQLGEGSYSTVVLATDKITSTKYAVKILDKRHIIKEKKVKYVNIEKHALNRLSDRMGIVSLYFTFQDKDSLYFVLDYASNGELLSLIKKYGTLNEECTKYFGAQILDAIKYMHDNGVIHRDIKPENILLDDKLRIQITDFGTARLLEKKNDESEEYPVDVRAKSFVGTAEYVSPELLENKYCGKPGDIWAFGCILYQMIAGKPPFKAANEYLTFQKITKLQYAYSAGFPLIMRDLIKQILVLQPSRRANISTIQGHYFFHDMDFDDYDQIWMKGVPDLAPYKMSAKSMMKIPELTKSPSTQSVAIRRQKKEQGKRVASEPSSSTGTGRPTNGRTTSANTSTNPAVNPAMVAAFVLNKKDGSSDAEDDESPDIPDTPTDEEVTNLSKTPSRSSVNNGHSTTSSRVPNTPQPEYIPGTNILRPTIHSIPSYSRASSRKRQPARPKPKSRIMEVTPLTPIENAWSKYLKHADERVLRIGAVIATKVPTEYFERKHRGLIHESPLGFKNQHKAGSSFLSQVVNGSSLRSGSTFDEAEYEADESKAITDFFLIEELPPVSTSSDTTISSKSSKFFSKLGISNKDKSGSAEPVTQHPLEKARTCTMLLTTHGRALIFFRNDPDANYRLISEVKLSFPFISFKEVVSNTSKLSKLLPTTATFAIQSNESTFVFEVEKYDINEWTEALAKSQANQFERMKIEKERAANPKPKTPLQSPKLMDSPEFGSRTGQTPPTPQSQPQQPEKPSASKSPPPQQREGIFNSRLQSRSSVKRKPPPPIKNSPTGVDMSTGLGNSSESGMLHAAQLAVSNNSHYVPTNNRRSSFSKEDKPMTSGKIVYSPSIPGQKKPITSMNSKFLARSQRKK